MLCFQIDYYRHTSLIVIMIEYEQDDFLGSHLPNVLVKEGAKVKESKYRDRNQRLFIRHCKVLMSMAKPPYRHCEE